MPTLIPDPLPAEVEALLKRRREWGADHHDEVWEGVLHMSPPPSPRHELIVTQLITLLQPLAKAKRMATLGAAGIGVTDDHRVPDLTLLRPPAVQWNSTAALAVEVLSWHEPADKKLGFYAAHHVDELVIIDPDQHTVPWLELVAQELVRSERLLASNRGRALARSRQSAGRSDCAVTAPVAALGEDQPSCDLHGRWPEYGRRESTDRSWLPLLSRPPERKRRRLGGVGDIGEANRRFTCRGALEATVAHSPRSAAVRKAASV